MSPIDALDPKYRLILCDVWGVVHDGVTLYPGATARLRSWRDAVAPGSDGVEADDHLGESLGGPTSKVHLRR